MLDSEWITATHVLARQALAGDNAAKSALYERVTTRHLEALCAVAGGTTRPADEITPMRRELLEALEELGPSRACTLQQTLALSAGTVPTTLERMRLAGWVTRDGYYWEVSPEGLELVGDE